MGLKENIQNRIAERNDQNERRRREAESEATRINDAAFQETKASLLSLLEQEMIEDMVGQHIDGPLGSGLRIAGFVFGKTTYAPFKYH